MGLSENKKKISYILRNNNGRLIDIAYKASEIIMNSSDAAPELLRFFFEEEFYVTDYTQTDDAQIISDDCVNDYIDKYAVEVWKWLNDVLDERPSINAFYKSLYSFLSDKRKIHNKQMRAFFLLCVWVDYRIPYYKPENGVKMSKAKFIDISKKISKTRAKAKTVVFTKYDTRTEESSVLIKLLESLSTQEEKAVLLASIIRNVEDRTRNPLPEKEDSNDTEKT